MRSFFAVLSALAISACAISQSFDFECQPSGVLPSDPSLACDGVASNNRGAGSGVTSAPSCSFPTSGSQYLALLASGGVAVPAGGPLVRPVSTNATEVRIPIPAGSTTISMSWDFFNAEGSPQTNYNDGLSVDVVNSSGAVVANLIYVDTHTPLASGAPCGPSGEIAPAGPQALVSALPPMGSCDYLSIVLWNGGDDSFDSAAFIDNVVFNSSIPGCQVPCVPVIGAPTLAAASMGFPGSLLVSMSSLPPGGTYFLAVTGNAGAYPAGWLYGIDITPQDLANELNIGWPFSGPVSASACTYGMASIGPIFGAPSGLTLYMVALGVQGPNLSGNVTAITNPVSYTIP